jgi:hypothetical protein
MKKVFLITVMFLAIGAIPVRAAVQVAVGQPSAAVTNGAFQGFGAEWDPFFWNTANQTRGLNQDDWNLITQRIKDMHPGIVRVMMQLSWATQDPNLGSWDWTNPQMLSVFKYLDFLKANDIDVVLTDWGWSLDKNNYGSPMGLYNSPTDMRFATGVATYLKHFIEDRGYTNIKYLVVGNEPDNEIANAARYGSSAYSNYTTMYRNIDQALKDNGMRSKIKLTGPDMGGDWDFMKTSVSDSHDILDTYDFHRYASTNETANTNLSGLWDSLWSHLDLWRTETMSRDSAAGSKLLLLTEMGGSGVGNYSGEINDAAISSYDYAMMMADYGTTLLTTRVNAGIAWCMHDMYYFDGGSLMQWGMWKFKQANWAIRPWGQTFALLMKFSPRGSLVASINGSPPQTPALSSFRSAALKRPDGGWSIFLVNRTSAAEQFNVSLPSAPSRPFDTYHVNSTTLATYPSSIIIPADGTLAANSSLSVSVPANSFLVLAEETATAVKAGDADGNGIVNGADYGIWLINYGKSTSLGARAGDFNTPPDGIVNGSDYGIWLANYGK